MQKHTLYIALLKHINEMINFSVNKQSSTFDTNSVPGFRGSQNIGRDPNR